MVTVGGWRLGWLADVEVETDTGLLLQIAVHRFRWWKFAPLWIPRQQIVAWEDGRITVRDAWAAPEPAKPPLGAPAFTPEPSCYADERP